MESRPDCKRKVKEGTVLSNKMQKTVVVNVEHTLRHPQYNKVITRSKRYYAHCEDATVKVGDRVTIEESRPMSRLKRWRVVGQGVKAQ